jgi:hypothetical protein
VPGVGTAIGGLAGAILGGFAGGTGGRLIENKVRDNKFNAGSALKEGALMRHSPVPALVSKLSKVPAIAVGI